MVSYAQVFRDLASRQLADPDLDTQAVEDILRPIAEDTASKEDWIRFLREAHGDIEDSKTSLIFIGEEEDFEVEADDIESVTDEPPTATFT